MRKNHWLLLSECNKDCHLPGFISRLSLEPSRDWHPAAALCRRVTNHLHLPPLLESPIHQPTWGCSPTPQILTWTPLLSLPSLPLPASHTFLGCAKAE